jgi:hypothetical protein
MSKRISQDRNQNQRPLWADEGDGGGFEEVDEKRYQVPEKREKEVFLKRKWIVGLLSYNSMICYLSLNFK